MAENSPTEGNVTDISPSGTRLSKRPLRNSDAIRIGGMIAKSVADDRLAMTDRDNMTQTVMVMAGVFMDNAERDFSLLCSDLLGITDDFDFKSYREQADEDSKDEAAKEAEYLEVEKTRINWRQFRLSDSQIREKMNDDILERFGDMDLDTIPLLLEEIVGQEGFAGFINASRRFSKAASGLSGLFQNLSKDKKPTASKTKKS